MPLRTPLSAGFEAGICFRFQARRERSPMELSQIRQFQKVAELEHITQAANELHIAQPALSRTIKGLEKELDLLLFDRENKKIKLNENGKILFRYAREIDSCLNEMHQAVAEKNAHDRDTIRILLRSIPPSLSQMMQEFREIWPEAHFKISTYVENATIFEDQFDFELGINLPEDIKFHSITLRKEELAVAVSSSHPLAQASSVRLSELSENTFIVLSMDPASQKNMTDYFNSVQFHPTVMLECTDSQSMCGLIEENMGIGLTSRYQWSGSRKKVSLIPIKGRQYLISTKLVWRKNKPLSPICEAFREYSQQAADYEGEKDKKA